MEGIGTAFILAGGKGERLAPLTLKTPKPMLELQGKTILEHQFELLRGNGIFNAIISVGYLKEKIIERIGDGKKFGINVSYVREEEPLGTAGPLNMARARLSKEENFLCFNADNLMDLDLKKMLEGHVSSSAIATIALVEVEDPRPYGIARLSGKRIIEFVEKPEPENAPSRYANSGFYIMAGKSLEFVPKKEGYCMLEREVFPHIARKGGLGAFLHHGKWFDIGTIEKYSRAEKEWGKGR